MSKKPFRIDKPGKYRTRDGRIATINKYRDGRACSWVGILSGVCETWQPSGQWVEVGNEENKRDLVSRVPKRARKVKAQWGIVVRPPKDIQTHKSARILAKSINACFIACRVAVRRVGGGR